MMDVVMSKRDLLRIVGHCMGAVDDGRSSNEALAGVRLTAEGNTLRAEGTDGRLFVRGQTHAEMADGGAVCIEAKALCACVAALPAGPVHITQGGSKGATFRAIGAPARFELRAPAEYAESFPAAPRPAVDARWIEIPTETLARLISSTAPMASKDETRPNINGILLEFAVGRVSMISTDGHRVSVVRLPAAGVSASAPAAMLIPRKALLVLGVLADEARMAGDVLSAFVAQGDGFMFFRVGGAMVAVENARGTFPPYHQVLPVDGDGAAFVRVGRTMLREAILSLAQMTDDRPKGSGKGWKGCVSGLRMTVEPMTLKVQIAGSAGVASDEMIAVTEGDVRGSWATAPHYVIEALDALSDQAEVLLRQRLEASLEPLGVYPAEPEEGEERFGVIMPMRMD